jgi:hypothetical protein
MFAGSPPPSLPDLAQRYSTLFAIVDQHWRSLMAKCNIAAALAAQNGQPAPQRPTFLPDPNEEALRQVLYRDGSPTSLKAPELKPYFEATARDTLEGLSQKVDQLRKSMPPAPEYAMVLEDAKGPHNAHVFLRGNPRNRGDEVPREGDAHTHARHATGTGPARDRRQRHRKSYGQLRNQRRVFRNQPTHIHAGFWRRVVCCRVAP